MAFVTRTATPLAPFIHLEEGDSLLVLVHQVREAINKDSSPIVEAQIPGGEAIALTGHYLLVDKLGDLDPEEASLVHITRLQKIGRSIDYDVQVWEGSYTKFLASKEGQDLVTHTQTFVDGQLAAVPPGS